MAKQLIVVKCEDLDARDEAVKSIRFALAADGVVGVPPGVEICVLPLNQPPALKPDMVGEIKTFDGDEYRQKLATAIADAIRQEPIAVEVQPAK